MSEEVNAISNVGPCRFVDCEQGSDEWRALRVGVCTGSRFPDVMTNGRAGQPSATVKSYQMELAVERLTQTPTPRIDAKQLEWGNRHEAEARSTYVWATNRPVHRSGFAFHGSIAGVGASVDGLVEPTDGVCPGTLEIKCPYNSRYHLDNIMNGTVPKDYYYQVQGALWITQRAWCDFVSYDPRMPDSHRLCVIRVNRDEAAIAELEKKVIEFLGGLDRLMAEIVEAGKMRCVS
jgi:hypothetical protein